jgi:hypothetical protein
VGEAALASAPKDGRWAAPKAAAHLEGGFDTGHPFLSGNYTWKNSFVINLPGDCPKSTFKIIGMLA